VMVTGGLTASVAVAVPMAGAAPQVPIVMSDGTVSVGPLVSRTVTVNVAVPTAPWVSVALQVTVVVAIAKVDPEAGVQVVGRGPSWASLAVAVKVTTAPAALVASTVMFAGTVTTGGGLPRTSTVIVPRVSLPAAARATP